MDLFSTAGIASWQQRLNRSPGFAAAAQSWSGRLLLIETQDDGPGRSAWIVVESGRCTEARTGAATDEKSAEFVLAASSATWSDLVEGRTTPATAALTRKLSLRKGDVMSLIPHAKAAAELLAAAADTSSS